MTAPDEHDCAALGCDEVATRAHAEAMAQGLPATVEDPVALRKVADVIARAARSKAERERRTLGAGLQKAY